MSGMKYDEEKSLLIARPEAFDQLAEEILQAVHTAFYAAFDDKSKAELRDLWRMFQCMGGLEEFFRVGAQDFLNRKVAEKKIQVVKV